MAELLSTLPYVSASAHCRETGRGIVIWRTSTSQTEELRPKPPFSGMGIMCCIVQSDFGDAAGTGAITHDSQRGRFDRRVGRRWYGGYPGYEREWSGLEAVSHKDNCSDSRDPQTIGVGAD